MRILPTLAAVNLSLAGWVLPLLPLLPLRPLTAQEFPAEEAPVDFDEFADLLAPYGRWVDVPDVGPCWQPRVDSSWAPYTVGSWAYTDAGWTWVSEEPFGGIVFHYGRWMLTPRGWYWVPGSHWGPAWVSWRTSPDYIGWAPLPPEVPWNVSRGIGSWVDVQADIGPQYYRFCSVRNFGATRLQTVVLPVSRNATILITTENVTSIRRRERWVHCGGPDYDWVNQRCARPVVSTQLVLQPSLQAFFSLGFSSRRTNVITDQGLFLPAPTRIQQPQAERFTVPPPRTVLQSTRGWSSNREADRKVASHVSQEWERHRSTQPAPADLPVPKSFPSATRPGTGLLPGAVSPSGTPTMPPAFPQSGSTAQENPTAGGFYKKPSSLKPTTPNGPTFVPPSPPAPSAGRVVGGDSAELPPSPDSSKNPNSSPSPGFARPKPVSSSLAPSVIFGGSQDARVLSPSAPATKRTSSSPSSTLPSESPLPSSSTGASSPSARGVITPQDSGMVTSPISPVSPSSTRPRPPSGFPSSGSQQPPPTSSGSFPRNPALPSSPSRSTPYPTPTPISTPIPTPTSPVTGSAGGSGRSPGTSRTIPSGNPDPTFPRSSSGSVPGTPPAGFSRTPPSSAPSSAGSGFPSSRFQPGSPAPSSSPFPAASPQRSTSSSGGAFPQPRQQPSSPAPSSSSFSAPSAPPRSASPAPAPSSSAPAKKTSSDKDDKK